ncbi:MAG: carboxypeptidase-like regulatory domain-containing protein [Flavobacteriaceae bacterium]|tara:strand:+ start:28 stop:1500 length:1473 start_codon:yes stop_codon:yes gene_type:complete
MKKLLFTTTLFFVCFLTFSQSITAKLVDKTTKTPIPFATIKTGEFSGVISNEEGYFTINSQNDIKTVTISCLGYQNKILSIKDIKTLRFLIELDLAINELNEIFISNRKPNADSIIAKVTLKIADNYDSDLNKYNIFHRATDYVNFKNLDFEIEKASHFKKKNLEAANTNLEALSKKIRESDMKYFTDFKGELYSLDKDSCKLIVNKATKLMDFKNDFSVDDIQEKAQKIMLTYLDSTKTYKLKTGLFKIEDSLALKDEDFKEDNENEFEISYLNNQTKSLLKHAQFYKNAFLNKLLNASLYDYTFEDITYNNGDLTYIISFEPRKGKAKYTGKLFVSDDTYAITKVDYTYYKNRHGEKLNLRFLLGIKYIANVSEGTILFEKNSDNKYQPKYIKRTSGSYFYVNRDLKFIENSRTRNKVGFSFKIEGDNLNKEELLITATNKLTFLDFQAERQAEKVSVTILSQYENTIWKNEETLEPLQEMKAFKSDE